MHYFIAYSRKPSMTPKIQQYTHLYFYALFILVLEVRARHDFLLPLLPPSMRHAASGCKASSSVNEEAEDDCMSSEFRVRV